MDVLGVPPLVLQRQTVYRKCSHEVWLTDANGNWKKSEGKEKNKQANKTAGHPCPLKDLVLASVLYRGHCSLTNAGRQMLRQTLNLGVI